MRPGMELGNYRLERLIGRGGGGEVYLATQHGAGGFSRTVAIKLLHEDSELSSSSSQRVAREARIIGRLQHRNIVQVYEVGEAEGTFFLAMELVDGLTLKQLIRRRGTDLPFWLGLHVGVEVCRALDHAHRAEDERGQPMGIVHRDVKPSNILLNRQGDVKLSDFGLAKASLLKADQLTAHGIVKGTPAYMAPEQRAGLPATAASDVFSLAMVVYEMCTGRRPAFAGHAVVPPASLASREPAIAAEDEAVVVSALAAEPQHRPAAAELGRVLARILGATRPGERMLRLDEDAASWVSQTLAIETGETSDPGADVPRPAPTALRRSRSEEITTADRREAAPARAEQPTHVWPHPGAPAAPAAPPSRQAPAPPQGLAHERLARAARGHDDVSVHRPDIAELAAQAPRAPSTQPVPPRPAPVARRAGRAAADADEAAAYVDEAAAAADEATAAAEEATAAAEEATADAEDSADPVPPVRRPAPAPLALEYAYHAQRTHRRVALLVLLGIALVLGYVAWKERLLTWPARRDAGGSVAPLRPAVTAEVPDAAAGDAGGTP